MAHNLILTSATFDTSGKKFGSAALSGGYGTTTAVVPSAYPFTIECWVFATAAQSPTTDTVLVGADLFGGIAYDRGSTRIYAFYNGNVLSSSVNPCNSAWHHCALVCDGAGARLYVDGNQEAASSTLYAKDASYAGALALNTYYAYEPFFLWPGKLDEVAVWNTAKYSGLTYTIPTAPYTGVESGLVALWHLDSDGADSISTVATTYTLNGPGSGSVGVASSPFTVQTSGTLAAGVTITPNDSSAGGTFTPSTVTLAAGANASATFTYTAATAGTKTIATTNSSTLTNPASRTYTASATTQTIVPSNPAIIYSPYTWSNGKTINAGAYFRMAFTGATLELDFDLTSLSTPYPQIQISIDNASPQQFTLAAAITPVMPTLTTGWPKHTLEVLVKSTSLNVNRWSPQAASVRLTAIRLDVAASVSAPTPQGRRVLLLGDSITEAAYTISNVGDTDGTDARTGWAYLQRSQLGAEVGVVGFASQGLTQVGGGGVPVLGSAYDLLWAGQARSFSPAPDLIVVNEGTNDGAASSGTFQTALASFLNGLLAAVPACPIAVMRPFNGTHAADITAVIAAIGNTRLVYVDTTGMFDTALSSDGVHPYGAANILAIAPAVGAKLKAIMDSAATGYRGGFKRAA